MKIQLGTLTIAATLAFGLAHSLAHSVAEAADAAKPDFSGVWTTYRGAGGAGRNDSAFPRDAPIKPEAKAKVDEYRALVAPEGLTPGGACVGYGMPASMLGSGGYPMEWIQRPEQITVVYEAHAEIRRIYMEPVPKDASQLVPARNGSSFGRWEGDTLVVETLGLKEAVDQSSAHSDKARIVERYSIAKDDKGDRVLTAEMTMTDDWYTKPVSVTKRWRAVPNGKLLPYECTEPQWDDLLDKLRQESNKDAKAAKK